MPLDSSRISDLWCSGACGRFLAGHYDDDSDGVDARRRARGRGWVCDETGDWCPRCREANERACHEAGSRVTHSVDCGVHESAPAPAVTGPARDPNRKGLR